MIWKEHMRVVIYGGRDFGNDILKSYQQAREEVYWGIMQLEHIAQEHAVATGVDVTDNWLPEWTVISGGAAGADRIGEEFAIINWCQLEVYKADWDKHGKAAGPIRNVQMLKEGKPDLGVAFPGGRGTAHMTSILKEAGVPVRELAYVRTQPTIEAERREVRGL